MQLHVRIRGRVHGPFAETKLCDMVHRGQLTRVHMVSVDGTTWQKASEFPELFETARLAPPAPVPADAATRKSQEADRYDEPSSNRPIDKGGPPVASEWYYSDGSTSIGPLPFATLKRMCDGGELTKDTLVWKPDFDGWKPARQVAGLFAAQKAVEVTQESSELSRSVTEPLISASGWVMFLGVLLLILGTSATVAFVFLLAGSGSRGSNDIFSALFAGVNAGIFFTLGIYLTRYSRLSARLRFVPTASVLASAMQTLKTCWIFLGIVAIVELSMIATGLYLVFAIGGSLRSL